MKNVSRTIGKPVLITEDGVCIGYGAEDLRVETIPCWLARTVIAARHYSKRFVNNSYLHLGIYSGRELVGVMQWGYALVPNSGRNVVHGTENREYMELNRLWVHDKMPKNTESRVISYALKAIKQIHPTVKWVQSFADERCGRAGVVYQASNFEYIGSHYSTFYELDGEWYHELAKSRKGGARGRHLQANLHRANKCKLKQFRYIRFLDKRARKNLNTERFKIQPYPKPNKEE